MLYNKKSSRNFLSFFADLPGLEPRTTGPKPDVLPLHHRSKLRCKDIKKSIRAK